MNGNGLSIDEEEFRKLKVADQLVILYKNQNEISKIVKSYKTHQKLQYWMLGVLSSTVVALAFLHLK